ncbi:MAG TPA: M20 family metallopeptidase [Tepidisphaeraceae bacterium]|nr:M20 family metallopeptidase [Tepidisphaeraceae bacterium]
MNVEAAIAQHVERVIDMRHRLHRIPELLYEEHQTAATIRAELDRLHLAHVDGVPAAPTATIVTIGDEKKPCVALRADIDALPIEERTGLPYTSIHPGRMHACGHDGHSAVLMGAAAVLKSMERELPVCVKFIWQPAEEGGGGAHRLVQAGALDGRIGPKVSAIFGLHGWPGLPVGAVATKPGPLLAATDNFRIAFVGRGCHGAFPHLGIDPIVPAAEAVLNLQQLVSRDFDPTEPAALTVGIFRAGSATNVIPDEATIEGTVRTISESARQMVRARIERRAAGIAAAGGCTINFTWLPGYPPTVNDPGMTDYVAKIARQTLGSERFIPVGRPSMGGEDFAYYLEKIPGCFFLLGVMPAGRDQYPSLHSDRYDFTDAAIGVGIRMFVELVLNFRA